MSALAIIVALLTSAPQAPTHWVTDASGALAADARARLDGRLEAYQRQTGHQVLVYLARSTGLVPIEDWAAEAFKSWRVGRSGLDDGVALFIFTDDHTARIEVGYGLEARLTDAACASILRDVLGPKLAAGETEKAISSALDAMQAKLGNEAGEPEPVYALSLLQWVGLLVGLIALGALLWRHPFLAMLLFSLTGRRSGGGFSGRGGRSGGGGASGRW